MRWLIVLGLAVGSLIAAMDGAAAADGGDPIIHVGRHGAAVVCRNDEAAIVILDEPLPPTESASPTLEERCPRATVAVFLLEHRAEAIDEGADPGDLDALVTLGEPFGWTDGAVAFRADPIDSTGEWTDADGRVEGRLDWDYSTATVCVLTHGDDRCSDAATVRRALHR